LVLFLLPSVAGDLTAPDDDDDDDDVDDDAAADDEDGDALLLADDRVAGDFTAGLLATAGAFLLSAAKDGFAAAAVGLAAGVGAAPDDGLSAGVALSPPGFVHATLVSFWSDDPDPAAAAVFLPLLGES
jgi:hypothetical protein